MITALTILFNLILTIIAAIATTQFYLRLYIDKIDGTNRKHIEEVEKLLKKYSYQYNSSETKASEEA